MGVGAVSVGISIFLTILADGALEDATAAYNQDLKFNLGAD
jgi:hypothetical protein